MKLDLKNRDRWLVMVMLVGLTLAAFWPVKDCDFITYDDPFYVTKNSDVNGGLTGRSVKWAFTAMHASNWHPLTWLSHMLDCELFGLDPRGHHSTNLTWHTANALLVSATAIDRHVGGGLRGSGQVRRCNTDGDKCNPICGIPGLVSVGGKKSSLVGTLSREPALS